MFCSRHQAANSSVCQLETSTCCWVILLGYCLKNAIQLNSQVDLPRQLPWKLQSSTKPGVNTGTLLGESAQNALYAFNLPLLQEL